MLPNQKWAAGKKGAVDIHGNPIRYVYTSDHLGRVKTAHARPLKRPAQKLERSWHNPRTPGKLQGDHAGHLFADMFGGSGDLSNLVSQSKGVNLTEVRILERKWDDILQSGKRLDVDIEVLYSGDELRPAGFVVTEFIDGVRQGPHDIFN